MLVVPVVEVPVQPILQIQRVGLAVRLHDVGVDGRSHPRRIPLEVLLIDTAGRQRTAGCIQIEPLPQTGDIGGGRAPHDDRVTPSDLAQRHLRIPHHHFHCRRYERFTVRITRLGLLFDHHIGREPVGQRLLGRAFLLLCGRSPGLGEHQRHDRSTTDDQPDELRRRYGRTPTGTGGCS